MAQNGPTRESVGGGRWAPRTIMPEAPQSNLRCLRRRFAHRPLAPDWADIEEITARQAGRLDTALIFRELGPLLELKEDPAATGRLKTLLERG